ncbi:MAG TPA: ABC transporter substrate-binding protein [Sphaerochaeta sp.]|nr:ABC transporter substrate-binding protein [Sphaerochaeta sp.]
MKFTIRFSKGVFMLLVSLGIVLGGLSAAAVSEKAVELRERSVIDMRGRAVSVPAEVKSVIALDAGSLRLITYLDAVDLVVAVEDAGHGREKSDYEFFSLATYRIAHPSLRELPSIGSAENYEALIGANPDLIISSAVDVQKLDHLQAMVDIPVLGVDVDIELYDIAAFYHQISLLGEVLDREARAESLNAGIATVLGDLEGRKREVSDVKRAYAAGMMYYGPADLLRTTGDFIPFDFIGVENVMPTNPVGNRQPYMTTLEHLIAAEPDYVFLDAANMHLSQAGYLANQKVLTELVPAFAAQEVYSTFVYKYYGTNWENQLVNVYFVGSVLYPELFGDKSVETYAEEIWELFFNLPLSYDTVAAVQGVRPGRVSWFGE